MRKRATAIVVISLFGAVSALAARTTPVSKSEADNWVRYTVPLPKQIEITGQVVLPANQITLRLTDSSDALVRSAARELRETIGLTQSANGEDARFTILLQLNGEGSAELRRLANGDQAYRIIPDAQRDELRLVALKPHGLYYAAKTLQQLLKANLGDGKVAIPIVEVTDWPDIATRGLWGADAYLHVRWLSDRKYNHMEQIATSLIDENKRAVCRLSGLKQRMLDDGPNYGINPVPAIVHLEHMGSKGVYEVYPALKAQGEGVHGGAACYSNPMIVDVLADWIIGYAKMKDINEVDLWLTENLNRKPSCQCEKCGKGNRDLLEAAAVVAAWKRAKQQFPDLKFWVLTSEETADSNEQILEVLPPEIRFWYYHSLTTYNTNSAPMIPGYLKKAAREGRYAGACLNLSSAVAHTQPFTGAEFIHARMNEFVDKKMAAFLGYPTPRVHYITFNVEAAAEWSWNAKGRSTHEFALSYAMRRGMDDPDLFAEWSETMGPVAWDVYGSHWPTDECRGALDKVYDQLKAGKLPELGFVLWDAYAKPWGDVKTIEQLDRDLTQAERGVELAKRLGNDELITESLVVQGYIRSLKALWELRQIVTANGIADQDRAAAQRYFMMYLDGLGQARTVLPQWEATLPRLPDQGLKAGKVVDLLDTMIAGMAATAGELGVKLD